MYYFMAARALPRRWKRRWWVRAPNTHGPPQTRRATRWMAERTTAPPATQHSRQELLVGDPLQQPDPLDDPDRPAFPSVSQPDQGPRQSTPTARWTCISARSRLPARRRTGFKRFRARVGTRSCGSTARWSRGSTRPGARARSRSSPLGRRAGTTGDTGRAGRSSRPAPQLRTGRLATDGPM